LGASSRRGGRRRLVSRIRTSSRFMVRRWVVPFGPSKCVRWPTSRREFISIGRHRESRRCTVRALSLPYYSGFLTGAFAGGTQWIRNLPSALISPESPGAASVHGAMAKRSGRCLPRVLKASWFGTSARTAATCGRCRRRSGATTSQSADRSARRALIIARHPPFRGSRRFPRRRRRSSSYSCTTTPVRIRCRYRQWRLGFKRRNRRERVAFMHCSRKVGSRSCRFPRPTEADANEQLVLGYGETSEVAAFVAVICRCSLAPMFAEPAR
jgi:hypothetical protein